MLINNILLHVERDEVEDSKATVIITHGIAEHSGRYQEMTKKLNKAGYTVVKYDIRGHGKSQGKRGKLKSYHQTIDDLHQIVLTEKKQKPKNIYLLGHSMGGLIVHMYVVKYNDIDGVIASAAPTYFISDVLPFRIIGYRWLGFIPRKTNFADGKLSRIKEVEQAYIDDPLNLKTFYFSLAGSMFIGGVRYLGHNVKKYKVPVLLIHGDADKSVPVEFSKKFLKAISSTDKELITFDGAYHEVFNDLCKKEAYTSLIKWLDHRTK